MTNDLRARIEQFRQACRIHGGASRMFAAAMGVRLSRVPIPSRRLRERLYRKIFGGKYRALNEGELDRPLGDYSSLNALFTRGIPPHLRPISQGEHEFVCPCDGVVQDLGRLTRDTLLTAKGIDYSLESLLPELETTRYHDGTFAIFFLSPSDGHRVFAPAAGLLREIVHVPGRRLLVHPPFQSREFPVFALNERVILRLSTDDGDYILVLVAGWGVGNISFPVATALHPRRRRVTHQVFDIPRRVERGEWLATFELGSTVILITEPAPTIASAIARDEQVFYGQPAFQFPPTDAETSYAQPNFE